MLLVSKRKLRSIDVPGTAIYRIRDAWLLSQEEFGAVLGASRSWVQAHEGPEVTTVDRRYLQRLGAEMGLSADATFELLGKLAHDRKFPVPPRTSKSENTSYKILAAGELMPAGFNLGIAAGGWVELDGEGITPNLKQIKNGWVIVHVKGDSMEPRWKHGQNVMFRLLNKDEDEPEVGEDYFVIRNDKYGTFKTLVKLDRDGYVLKARNKRYPKLLTISRQEAVMIAEAKFVVADPPPADEE